MKASDPMRVTCLSTAIDTPPGILSPRRRIDGASDPASQSRKTRRNRATQCLLERGLRRPRAATAKALIAIVPMGSDLVAALWAAVAPNRSFRPCFTQDERLAYTDGMARHPEDRRPVDQVIGYVRVSTVEQGDSGAGLEAQRRAITAYCQSRGWTLIRVEQDVTSGASTNGRHGLADALAAIRHGEAGTLVVAKLDRLSRSVGDFASMLAAARREGWNLAVLDLGCDLSTPMGEAMAGMASVFAQFERRVIGERTKAALQVKRSQGIVLGRRPAIEASIRALIHQLREQGRTLQAIADQLNGQAVPTVGGGPWQTSTIQRVLGG